MSHILISIGIGVATGLAFVIAWTVVATRMGKIEWEVLGTVKVFGLSPMVVYFIGFAFGFYLALKFSN
jgi:hypothetical protein